MAPALLAGEWRDLALLNWFVDPAILRPRVPAGAELDTWEGRGVLSLVGLRFLHLRLLGLPVPGMQAFTQVNVRFYVRRRVGEEIRHGVCFVLAMVPRRLLTLGARLAMHEPFETFPTRVAHHRAPDGAGGLSYQWQGGNQGGTGDGGWHRMQVVLDAAAVRAPEDGSLETFVLHRFWGFTQQPDGTTLEYRVEHPCWRVAAVNDFDLSAQWEGLRVPAEVRTALAGPASFALYAEGSEARMYRPYPLNVPGNAR